MNPDLVRRLRALNPSDAEFNAAVGDERRAARWKPGKADVAPPPTWLRCETPDLVGTWMPSQGGMLAGFCGTSLELTRKAVGSYRVVVGQYGCTATYYLERDGVYHDGVLRLNRPICASGSMCDRLFTVRTSHGARLIASAWLEHALGFGKREADEARRWLAAREAAGKLDPKKRQELLRHVRRFGDLESWSLGVEPGKPISTRTPPARARNLM